MADRGDRCNRRPGRRATGRDPNGWTPPDNSRTPSPLGVPLSPDNEDLAQMLAAQPRNRQPSRSPSPSPQASHLCPARSQSPRRATPPGDWTPPAVQFQPGSPLAYGLLPSPENARDYGQRPPSRSPPRPDFGQCGPPRTTPPPAFQQSPAGQCNADYFNLSGPGWEPPRWDSPLEDSTPSPSPTAQRQTRRRIAFTSSPAGTCAPPTSQDPDGPLAWALPSSPENAGDCGRRPPSRSSPRPDFGQCGPPQPPAFQQSPAGQCNADYFNLSGPGWEPPRWDSPLEDSTPTPSPRTRRSTSPSVHPNARRRLSFTPSPAGTCPPPTSQDPDSPLARPLPSSPENAAGDYVPRPGPSRGGHHGGCRPPGTPRGYPHHSRSPSPQAQRIDPRMVLGAEFFAGEAPELIASGSRDLLDDSWELPGWAAGGSSCEASPDYGFGAANPLAASSPCTEPQTRRSTSPSPRRSHPSSPDDSDCVFIPPSPPPFVDLCSPTSAQDPGSPLARALPSSPENEAGDYDPRPGPSRGGHPGGCRPPRTPRGYPHHSRSPSPQGGYVPIPGPSRGVPGHHGPRGWFRPPPTPRGYPNDSLSPSPQAAGGNVPRPGPSRGGHHGGCRPPRTPRGYPYDSRSPSPQGPVPAPPVRRGRRSPREMVGDWPQDLEMWPNESPRIDPRMVLGAEFFADEAPELIGSGSRDLLDDSWELPGWAAGDSTCEDYGFGAANPLAASSPNDSPFRAPVRRRLNFSGSLPAAAGMPSPGSFGAHHSGNLPSPGDGHGGEWNPASGIYDPAYYSGNLLSPGAGYSAEWSPGSGFEQAYHSDSLLSPGDDLWSSAEWSLGSGGFEPAHLSGSPLAVPLGPGDGYDAEWSLGSAGFEPAYHSGSLLSPGDVFWPSAEWSPGSGGFEQTFQDSYEDFHPQACSTPMPPDYDDFY